MKGLVEMQQRRGRADLSWRTHTFSGGDVNRAGDVGEALVHAHLQVDHSAKQANITHTPDGSSFGMPLRILQSTWAILALVAHKHANTDNAKVLHPLKESSLPGAEPGL